MSSLLNVSKMVGNPQSIAARKILIASDLSEMKLEVESTTGNANTADVICYRTSQGVQISMASAALRHIARCRPDSMLYGSSLSENAETDQWLTWVDVELDPLLRQCIAWVGQKEMCVSKSKADIISTLSKTVELRLLERTFIAGQRLSVADISLACSLWNVINVVDPSLLVNASPPLPCTLRWYQTVVMQPLVAKHLQQIPASPQKIPATIDSVPKTTDSALKTTDSAAPKTTDTASGADIEDEIAADEKARSKKTNPLDLLPPTPLVLDEWKRVYSNTKDLRGVAMPWFWSNLDRLGWSVWYIRYDKLEGECTVGYATGNQLSGFLQRIEPSFRKYSFGVFNVVGSDGCFDIQGVLMIRGLEIPAELTEHPSYSYHHFRKLNLDDASDKALIEDYWCNDETVENRPIESCKVWK